MAIPAEAKAILRDAVASGVGSAAALAWQVGGDRELFAIGRTTFPQWSNHSIDTHAQFDLASLTKPISTLTLLVGELAERHVALDDRLDAHLAIARGTARGAATVGQLLSHTSGAPAWLDFFAATHEVATDRRVQAVQQAVLTTPNTYTPGTQAIYSDLGFMALGWLLEAVTGKSLDVLFAERVAAPLGLQAEFRRLSRSESAPDAIVATEVWPPRSRNGEPLRGVVHDDNCAALDGVAGHAGLFGSVADVATWAACWLAAVRGTTGGAQALNLPPALCQTLARLAGCPGTSWRHGWDTPTRPGSSAGELVPDDAFGHLGFTGTSVWFAPESNAFAALLTNRVHPSRDAVSGIRALRPRLHDCLWRALPATSAALQTR